MQFQLLLDEVLVVFPIFSGGGRSSLLNFMSGGSDTDPKNSTSTASCELGNVLTAQTGFLLQF